MRNKSIWIAVQVTEGDKFYAYGLRVSEYDNLIKKISIPGIVAANVCSSRKAMQDTVTAWNDTFIANGLHMFQGPENPF